MARLYLFAIGGTGSRVLRALTHLLAAGATIRNGSGQSMELVPLVIDPDAENADTLECLRTLRAYNDLRSRHLEPGGHWGTFLGTKVSRFNDLRADGGEHIRRGVAGGVPLVLENDTFRCSLVEKGRGLMFREVVGHNTLDAPTRLLVDALYSDANLETSLSGGFLGNPNLGTVVLNKIKNSDQFRMLPGLFHDEDRIFIISSIFGGTGASGFPVVVKLLQDAKDDQGNAVPTLRNAPIGALTVLPYFSIEADGRSPIDSNAFIPKTKAALAYYAQHLDGIESLYYIGDKAHKQYPNNPTGERQSNQDHVVELLGATAVLHYARSSTGQHRNGRFLECAVEYRKDGSLNFASLGPALNAEVGEPLTAFAMASRFLEETTAPKALRQLRWQPWASEGSFDRGFFAQRAEGMPYNALQTYMRMWWDCLGQMALNEPAFRPFGHGLEKLRDDREELALDTNVLNMMLNRLSMSGDYGPPGSIRRLLHLLSDGTNALCEELLGSSAPLV